MRWLIVALTCTIALSHAKAQDMPLSQVLIEGEGWKEVPRSTAVFPPRLAVHAPGIEHATWQVYSPLAGTWFVASSTGKYVWAFRGEKDGSLTAGQPYCSLHVPRGQSDMPVNALTLDSEGRIYAATPIGVQIFDPTGRLCGVLTKPSREPLTDVNLAGPEGDLLYVADKNGVYVRKVKSHRMGFGGVK
jgi:hypothetical protein